MARNYRVRLKEHCDGNNEALQYKTKELAYRRKDIPKFISHVVVGRQSYGSGRKRRKEAEENAANIALNKLKKHKGTLFSWCLQ